MGSYIEQRKKYLRAVLREHRKTGLSSYQLSKKFPVSDSTIQRWICNFADEFQESKNMKKSSTPKLAVGKTAPEVIPSANTPQETAEEKIARLEKELKDANLRADLYNEIINVAEKKFNIQIRKKAGTKQ
jgi:transposase